jgi:hypothetical protein
VTIPALKKMQKNAPRTFAMKFDALCTLYGDPLAGLFALAYGTQDEELRLRALAELLPYRHPRLKQVEHTGDGRTGPQVVMQINMSPSQAAQVAQLTQGPGLSRAISPTFTGDRSLMTPDHAQGEGVGDAPGAPASPGQDEK